jgi:hypothetical protein
MSNTEVVDDVLNNTDAFSDGDGPQCARMSAKEMNRRSKKTDKTVESVSDAISAIVFFH